MNNTTPAKKKEDLFKHQIERAKKAKQAKGSTLTTDEFIKCLKTVRSEDKEEVIRTTFLLPKSYRDGLKIVAARRGMKMIELLTSIIKPIIEEELKNKK